MKVVDFSFADSTCYAVIGQSAFRGGVFGNVKCTRMLAFFHSLYLSEMFFISGNPFRLTICNWNSWDSGWTTQECCCGLDATQRTNRGETCLGVWWTDIIVMGESCYLCRVCPMGATRNILLFVLQWHFVVSEGIAFTRCLMRFELQRTRTNSLLWDIMYTSHVGYVVVFYINEVKVVPIIFPSWKR